MDLTDKGHIGEAFVNAIAFNSFMDYWCYPSPKDETGDKKEICDLLILFDNNLVIISVKNYEFKELYSRYFRNTIDKAVKQIYGAERKLFTSDRSIFIKHPQRAAARFPKAKIKNIYRVIVNLGEGVRFYPFNQEAKDEKFITILDKEAFETIVQELDTISDFLEYLRKREELFAAKTVIILPGDENNFSHDTGEQFSEYTKQQFDPSEKQTVLISGTEQDLLAYYLKNERCFPEILHLDKSNIIFIQLDGNWLNFISNEQVLKKKELDEKSYFIDNLVKKALLNTPNPSSMSEELAKELLSFDRYNRRIITGDIFKFYEASKNNRGLNIARRYIEIDEIGIVFVFYTPDMPQQFVNFVLEIALNSFCLHTNYKKSTMIMIAITKNFSGFKLDLMKNIKPFSKEKEDQIKADVKKLGWFTNHQTGHINEYEYPQ